MEKCPRSRVLGRLGPDNYWFLVASILAGLPAVGHCWPIWRANLGPNCGKIGAWSPPLLRPPLGVPTVLEAVKRILDRPPQGSQAPQFGRVHLQGLQQAKWKREVFIACCLLARLMWREV